MRPLPALEALLARGATSILIGLSATGAALAQSDGCGSATVIGTGTFNGSTAGATNDGSASCGQSSTSPDVWFRFDAAASCPIRVTTCGSSFDTVLSVHSACPGTAANELACNDDSCGLSSAVQVAGQAGTAYLIRVAGFQGATGAFSLNVSCAPPPPSDGCANAIPIGAGTFFGDTTGSSNDGSASCGESATSPDVWYRFTATEACALNATTCGGATWDTVLSIHAACPGTAANELACNDDSCGSIQSTVAIGAQAGASYLIRVAGFRGAVGSFALTVSCSGAPPSDSCANATPVDVGTFTGDTTLATNDGSAGCGDSATSPDAWYRFDATEECRLRVTTCGSTWDTVLSIHDGCPGTAANELACNDDSCGTQSVVSTRTQPGATYFIRVAGYRGATGPFTLNVTCDPITPTNGPDVLVGELTSLQQFGRLGDVVGCGFDSPCCNAGDAPLDWYGNPDPRHPFMSGNLFRLRQGRFEQIGQSWVKHGFGAGQADACGLGCSPYPDATHLGVGCSDTYDSSTNAYQPGLGPRHEINPWTGAFSYAGSHMSTGHGHNPVEHRLQIHDSDLDPALNAGAAYFVEVLIVAHDDVNHLNSVAWEPVSISGAPGGTWSFNIGGGNSRVGPAIEAWSGATRTVIPQNPVDDGRCFLAVQATDNGNATWHYEYVLYNFDLDRGVGSFSIPLAPDTLVSNVGFHAVESSDEGYSNLPWQATRDASGLSFATDPYVSNPNANPIRWGSAYTFRFDASAGPGPSTATLGLYKPGTPAELLGATQGPSLGRCLAGTVNAGPTPVTDVLLVNGSAGDPGTRIVSAAIGAPIDVALAAAPAGPVSARYSLWAWRELPALETDLVARGQTLGCTVNPTPLSAGEVPQPFRCLRGGVPRSLCGPVRELGGAPARAPWILTRAQGFPLAIDVTLQGVLEDAGAANSLGFSVTNAVVLRVR